MTTWYDVGGRVLAAAVQSGGWIDMPWRLRMLIHHFGALTSNRAFGRSRGFQDYKESRRKLVEHIVRSGHW